VIRKIKHSCYRPKEEGTSKEHQKVPKILRDTIKKVSTGGLL